MIRLISMALCITLAAAAGVLYFEQTRQATVLVATRDLSVGSQIGDQDITERTISAAAAPADVLPASADAIGEYVAYPVLAGQFLQRRQVSASPSGAQLTHGLAVPAGSRLISLPVTPAAAVGGVLQPGDLVDVLAVSSADHLGGSGVDISSPPVLLGQRILVVGLRTDQGTSIDASPRALGVDQKMGAVLLAIPASDEARYAAAIPGSSFQLVLVPD